ncbi:MAG: glutathione S-transferase C-terminal domain-containing protein [Pseudomonadota bacterium]
MARERKWRWIQDGIDAPGAADQIRLYDGYPGRMEETLQSQPWLTGESFTMADIALAPYLNRLDALSMQGMWKNGRYPRVEDWFDRLRARRSFVPALRDWVPRELEAEMARNGRNTWPAISRMLQIPAAG